MAILAGLADDAEQKLQWVASRALQLYREL